MTLEQIIEWGKSQPLNRHGTVVDTEGQFSREETEQLRRQLREYYRNRVRDVYGSRRQGYEWELPHLGVAIGVTNGHASHFCIYYRPLRQAGNG